MLEILRKRECMIEIQTENERERDRRSETCTRSKKVREKKVD